MPPPKSRVAAWRLLKMARRSLISDLGPSHFRLLETSRNVVLRRVPKLVKAVMMAIAISDAISAYSMAVAPDSLAMNALMRSVMISFQAPAAH